jgi:hypothetical protein
VPQQTPLEEALTASLVAGAVTANFLVTEEADEAEAAAPEEEDRGVCKSAARRRISALWLDDGGTGMACQEKPPLHPW